MLFNSYLFILAFLPLSLGGYFLLNGAGLYRAGLYFLFGMSLWFYGANTPVYLILILSSIAVNYGFFLLSKKMTKYRRAAKIFALVLNLAVLFIFKYYDFFVSTVNSLFASDWTLRHIVLPLGISFFTFQQISFVIDAFNGEVPDYGFIEYACFVSFFPQLVAGPIVTHDELVPQLADEKRKGFNWENFSRGIYIFAMGLGKKVLLADNLSFLVGAGFSGETPFADSLGCFLVGVAYTLQLYFDFSGYSDMAIGIGRMFNIELPQNFNSPYKAENITDFWKRWHITLTRFFRKYVYFPLGGSRRGEFATYRNILIVFLLSGLWHGANWTFVMWGLMHGLAQVVHRLGKKFFDRIPQFIGRTVTFFYVCLCFIMFRANSVGQGFAIIKRIFEFDFSLGIAPFAHTVNISELRILLSALPFAGKYLSSVNGVMWVFLVLLLTIAAFTPNAYEKMQKMRPNVVNLLFSSGLVIWCLLSFGKVSEFLYFNF